MGINRKAVLINCSASKAHPVAKDLKWKEGMTLDKWKKLWRSQTELHLVSGLYSGYNFNQQIKLCELFSTDCFVISAGAGLLNLSDKIPSYDSSFIGDNGPKVGEWNELPMGNLELLANADEIILFCPPQYQLAIKSDIYFDQIKDRLVVGRNSPLSKDVGRVLPIPNRASEILECSQTHLSTKLLKLYLEEGVDGFEQLEKKVTLLPEKRITRKVNDNELIDVVRDFIHLGGLIKIVRAIRDTTDIAASYERIRNARNEILTSSGADYVKL